MEERNIEIEQRTVTIDRKSLPGTGAETLCRLFEEQAAKTPHHIALNAGTGAGHPCKNSKDLVQVSYRVLDEKAEQLAASLNRKGIKPDDIVALSMEPSVNMIAGILGILKAGGAYLPIDPDAPEERIRYILADSGARIVLSGERERSEKSEKSEWIELSAILTPPSPA